MAQHALLVGIDRYPGFPAHNQLSSCVADARLLADVLSGRFGFPEGNVNLLCNEAATRRGILDALEGLACWVQPEDIVVFYYSGHGSEHRDQAGSRANVDVDESVEWEQTLVPHDSGRDGRLPVRDIRDDQLYEWILRVNDTTRYVTVILDSCHAGTAVRSVARIKQVAPPRGAPPRSLAPRDATTRRFGSLPSVRSSPLQHRDHRKPGDPRDRGAERGVSGWRVNDRYTLLAACHHTETAKEYTVPDTGGLKHGAFTWFLARELQRLAPGSSYRDLMEAVRSGVSSVYPTQTPQVEGARDRTVFGAADLTPQRFLAVEGRRESRVTLAGGAAHGITSGSEWAIFPPSTRRFDDEGEALGRVRITGVRAVTSEAEILAADRVAAEKGRTGVGITVGCRASEVSHREELSLPVWVQVEGEGHDDGDRLARLVMALCTRIRESALLRSVLPGEIPGVIVHASADETWRLTLADGSLLRVPYPVFEPGSVVRVIEDLEIRSRFLHVERLVDLDPGNPLRDRVELTLLRQGPDGSWSPAEKSGEAEEPVYREGEALAIELAHRFDRPLYLHVLCLGPTGGVTLIHPVAGASQAQEPERRVRLGVRTGEELPVSLPAEHPTGSGRLRIKLFATTHETDLSWLVQKRYREAGKRSVLERRLAAALQGGARREAISGPAPDDELWTAVTRSFRVRARRAESGLSGSSLPSGSRSEAQPSQAMTRSRPSRLAR